MWPSKFQDRLKQWHDLRQQSLSRPLEQCLEDINFWWMNSPWTAYYLHWDDQPRWPDPWQLLSDNIYCDLARSLGIVYTILMIERTDITSSAIIETDRGNLVQVNLGKYILNWTQDGLLNNPSTEFAIKKSLDSSKLIHLLG